MTGATVIVAGDEATPAVVRSALKDLVVQAEGRRTWAVVGEMPGLGDEAMAEHDAIGRLAVRLDVSQLVCVGESARVMHLGASTEGSWNEESVLVADADAAIAFLRSRVGPDDIVLVVTQCGEGLDRVAAALRADAGETEVSG